MSTEHYLLGQSTDTKPSVSIVEHSCKFDFLVYGHGHEPEWVEVPDMTEDQLKEMAQKLVNVISYYDPDYDGCTVKY